jgi:O-antigen ligase
MNCSTLALATQESEGSVPSFGLSLLERFLLLVGIVEIPLQIDKYFMYRINDAEFGAVGGINVSFTTVSLVLLYTLWMIRWAVERPPQHQTWTIGIPMLIYITAVAFSILVASVPILAFFDVTLLVQAYLLFFYVANRVRNSADIRFCLGAMSITLLVQSLIILLLALIGYDDARITIGPVVFVVWEGQRQAGTMQSPVLAGSTMALLWLPITSLLFARISRFWWWCALAVVGVGLPAMLLTQTRGAILTSIVGTGILGFGLLLRGWLPKWTIILALIAAVISIYPLFMVYVKRVRSGDGESAISRKHLSLMALEMIRERPLFGYGAGNCHLAGEKFANQSDYRPEWYYTVHSKYLLTWVETGIVGFISFLAILGNGLLQGWRTWRMSDPQWSPIGLALCAALAGHSLHLAVDIFNSRTQVQILWLVLGLVTAVYRTAQPEWMPNRISARIRQPIRQNYLSSWGRIAQ